MKSIGYLLIFLLLCTRIMAQQMNKPDDALLLDYYQNQRFTEAFDYLAKVYTGPVISQKALAQLAYTANMAGRLAEAEGYYQRIYDADPTNTAVLYSLGSLNLRRGNSLKAENFYKRILTRDTTNFLVYKQLAGISSDKNDINSVVLFLRKANELNPGEADVASDLSDLYVSMKFNAEAEKVLNKAVAADPENIVLLNSLLKLLYAEKNWSQAVGVGLKLVANGITSGQVLTKMGVAYYQLKNYECGVATFADITDMAQSETSYYYAALSYKALKDHRTAIDKMYKAIEQGVSPNVASYYGEIADSNEKLLKFKTAVLAYKKSVQFDDQNPMIYYAMASLYDAGLKDRKNAVRFYKRYLSLNPPMAKQQSFIKYSKSRLAMLSR